MPLQPALNYESVRPKPLPFWRRNVLLWAIIRWNGYGFAVIGPVFFVLGVLSFFAEFDGWMQMNGEPVETVAQKIVWAISSLVIGVLGIWFVAWHRSSRRSGDEA